ncbi:MAG: hypothetical protein AB9866_12175 [Syntrophobacteraceae bacterium]
MKVLSVKQARSFWFFHLTDLNPSGQNVLRLIPFIVEKYNFLQFPNLMQDVDMSKGLKFSRGAFSTGLGEVEIEFTLFADGLLADTFSNTDNSDAFLDELLNWLANDFALAPYEDILRSKAYVSELWVRCNRPLNAVNSRLAGFTEYLSSLVEGHSHHPISYETSGIVCWTDPTILNPPSPFRFERAADSLFEENRYYTVAPLRTEKHLEILERLEEILTY